MPSGAVVPLLYMSNTGPTVEVFDPSTDLLVAGPNTTGPGGAIAARPDNLQVWNTGDPTFGSGNTNRIDTTTNTRIGTTPISGGPGVDVCFSPNSLIGYILLPTTTTTWRVTAFDTTSLAILATATSTNTSGLSPTNMCITADGTHIYVSVNNGISVITTSSMTITSTIAPPTGFIGPIGLRCNNASTTVYACTSKTSGTNPGAYIFIIDTASHTITGEIDAHTIGQGANQIAISADDSFAYTDINTPTAASYVNVVKLNLLTATVVGVATTGGAGTLRNLQGLVILPDMTKVYVCDSGTVANGHLCSFDCSTNTGLNSITTTTPYDICVTNPITAPPMQIVMVI